MIKNLRKRKGQGSLEYLLIIGGALVVTVIVVALIMSISRTHVEEANKSDEAYQGLMDKTIIPPIITNVSCTTSEITVMLNGSPTKGVDSYCLVLDGQTNMTGCVSMSNGQVVFNETLTADTEYEISLVARKGTEAHSPPVRPSYTCKPE